MQKYFNTSTHKNFALISFLSSAMILGSTNPSHARNGFIPHYVGIEGMVAGAGTACPLDATSTIANPAALARLGSHILFNIGGIYQDQHVDSSKALLGNPVGKQRNGYNFIFPLTFGFNIRLNEQWAVGFAATGGGGFVKFDKPVTNPAGLVPPNSDFNKKTVNSVTLTATTLAYSPTPAQTYGISALVASSTFQSDMMLADGTQVTGALSKDRVFGFGVRIGGMWNLNKHITLGASVATPVYCHEHENYKQLFGNDKFQIPATARLGITWHVSPSTDFSFDLKELFYGASKWVNNGQGWRNQFIILTGIMHRFTENFSAGIGYNYAKVPFKEDKVVFNTLSIPLDEHHISGGLRYIMDNKKTEFFIMGYYIPRKKMTDNGQGLPGGISKGIEIDNASSGFEIGIKYNF